MIEIFDPVTGKITFIPEDGIRGVQGIPGEIGPTGGRGPIGPVGPQGPKGNNGDQGLRGIVGPQGAHGFPGVNGKDGKQGLPGKDANPAHKIWRPHSAGYPDNAIGINGDWAFNIAWEIFYKENDKWIFFRSFETSGSRSTSFQRFTADDNLNMGCFTIINSGDISHGALCPTPEWTIENLASGDMTFKVPSSTQKFNFTGATGSATMNIIPGVIGTSDTQITSVGTGLYLVSGGNFKMYGSGTGVFTYTPGTAIVRSQLEFSGASSGSVHQIKIPDNHYFRFIDGNANTDAIQISVGTTTGTASIIESVVDGLRLQVPTGISSFVNIGPKWKSSDSVAYVVGGGNQEIVQMNPTWTAIATDATPNVAAMRFAPTFNHTSGGSNSFSQLFAIYANPAFYSNASSTDFAGNMYAISAAAGWTGNLRTLGTLTGLTAQANTTTSGTITNCWAVNAQALTALGGTITNAVSVRGLGPITFLGGSIGYAYSALFTTPTAGTLANWVIAAQGTGNSYFEGKASFGHTSVPNFTVDAVSVRVRSAGYFRMGGTGSADNSAAWYAATNGFTMLGTNGSYNTGITWDFNTSLNVVGMKSLLTLNTMWNNFDRTVWGGNSTANLIVATSTLSAFHTLNHDSLATNEITALFRRADTTSPVTLTAARSRGTLISAPSANQASDTLFIFNYSGHDGTDYVYAARDEVSLASGSTVGADNLTGARTFNCAIAGVLKPFLYMQGNGTDAAFSKFNGISRAATVTDDIDVIMASTNQANMFFMDCGNDRIGIGSNAPTARLHLMAGTATASTAPFKFTEGTNLTTAEPGAMEYDGKVLYFTRALARRRVLVGDDAIISNTTVSNTTTETTIFTATLGANTQSVQDVIFIITSGFYSTANASDTFTMRFKIGGVTILSAISTASNVTNASWHSEFFTTIRTLGATGTCVSHVTIDANNEGKDSTSLTDTVIDTTASNTFTVTVQWDSANASNTLTINQGFTKFI